MKVRLVLLGCAATLALAACGVRGDLERPGPMFGGAKADYEARQRAAAATGAPSVVPLPPPPTTSIRTSTMSAPIPPSSSDGAAPSASPPN
jgi:Prokaryotic lipoprotein-attachment site